MTLLNKLKEAFPGKVIKSEMHTCNRQVITVGRVQVVVDDMSWASDEVRRGKVTVMLKDLDGQLPLIISAIKAKEGV